MQFLAHSRPFFFRYVNTSLYTKIYKMCPAEFLSRHVNEDCWVRSSSEEEETCVTSKGRNCMVPQ
jgi:hypothetical protein